MKVGNRDVLDLYVLRVLDNNSVIIAVVNRYVVDNPVQDIQHLDPDVPFFQGEVINPDILELASVRVRNDHTRPGLAPFEGIAVSVQYHVGNLDPYSPETGELIAPRVILVEIIRIRGRYVPVARCRDVHRVDVAPTYFRIVQWRVRVGGDREVECRLVEPSAG